MAGPDESRGAGEAADPEGWVDRHGDALYRFAMLRLGDPEAAAEAVQEAFVAALRGRSAFGGRSTERTWLIGILKHKVVDHLRRRAGRDAAGDEPAAGAFFDGRSGWRSPPGRWAEGAAEAAGRAEFWEVFGRCLADLPPKLAEAFTLREVDGLEFEEIRDVLGISATNLHSRLHRARLILRDSLQRRWFGLR